MKPLIAALTLLFVAGLFATDLRPASTVMAAPLDQIASPTPSITGTALTTTPTVPTNIASPTASVGTVTATTTVTTTSTPTPTAGGPTTTPTIAPNDEAPTIITVTGYRITFLGYNRNGDSSTTWRYRLEELSGAPNLSSWTLGLAGCAVGGATPAPNEIVNPDPESGINGVRWMLGPDFTTGEFAVTLTNASRVRFVNVAVKGDEVLSGRIAGPGCDNGNGDGGNNGDEDEDEGDGDSGNNRPPSVIVIERPAPPVVVIENGTPFVVVVININNTGGRARSTFFVLDLDLLELADLRFLEGAGYVREIIGNQIIIGIGENNSVAAERISLNLRLRVRGNIRVQQTVTVTYRLRYDDSGGARETEPVVLPVIVPPVDGNLPTVTPAPSSTATPAPTQPVSPTVVVLPRLLEVDIDVRFRVRWRQGGGLRIYGLPLTRAVTLRSGIMVQYFERARFEYRPEFAGTPNEVLFGLLGVELGFARPPVEPPTATSEQVWYFPATGQLIAAPFRTTWRDEGSLRTFGYPIGAAFTDERGMLVQYFERVRLERSADGASDLILLGLLGEEVLISRGGTIDDD